MFIFLITNEYGHYFTYQAFVILLGMSFLYFAHIAIM